MDAGEGKWVTITLSRYDLSNWDAAKQGWKKPDGDICLTVGGSSRVGRLTGVISI